MTVALCESGECFEAAGRHETKCALQSAADDIGERLFETRTHFVIEPFVCELGGVERNELAPLLALGKHGGDQGNDVVEVGVSVQEYGAQRLVERGVFSAEPHGGASSGAAIECVGIFEQRAVATRSGEYRDAVGQRGTHGVDGANVQTLRILQQLPALLCGTMEHVTGDLAGFALEGRGCRGQLGFSLRLLQLAQNTFTQFRGGFSRERDGQQLRWVVELRIKVETENSLHHQTGFA